MKKKGRGYSLISYTDILILKCLINKSPLKTMEIQEITKISHKDIKKRLEHLSKYKIIKQKKDKKTIHNSINEEKRKIIVEIIKLFIPSFKHT